MDQELADTAAYMPGRCCMCTHQIAALFCAKRRHVRHTERMTSYQKSDSVNRCPFTWRTVTPRFSLFQFEMTALGFSVKWRHGRHLGSMTSHQKSNFINQCIFTWRTLPQNFIPSNLKQWSFRLFLKTLTGPNKKNNNTSCDMGSVYDPKTTNANRILLLELQ